MPAQMKRLLKKPSPITKHASSSGLKNVFNKVHHDSNIRKQLGADGNVFVVNNVVNTGGSNSAHTTDCCYGKENKTQTFQKESTFLSLLSRASGPR